MAALAPSDLTPQQRPTLVPSAPANAEPHFKFQLGNLLFAQGEFAMLGAVFTAVLAKAGMPVGISAAIAVLACAMLAGGFYQFIDVPISFATDQPSSFAAPVSEQR